MHNDLLLLQKDFRKENNFTRWVSIVGIVIGGGLGILSLVFAAYAFMQSPRVADFEKLHAIVASTNSSITNTNSSITKLSDNIDKMRIEVNKTTKALSNSIIESNINFGTVGKIIETNSAASRAEIRALIEALEKRP